MGAFSFVSSYRHRDPFQTMRLAMFQNADIHCLMYKCIEQSVSYPKEYLFCFALLCFRQARLEFCCRGFWSLSYWISSYFVKFVNRQQSKRCNLSKNNVLFIKAIKLECLFLIILLCLQKTWTNWLHNTSQWCRFTGKGHVVYSVEW